MAREIPTIGVCGTHDHCRICKFPPYVKNQITMDLLLTRKTLEELPKRYPFGWPVTLEELEVHAEHCDPSAVPDDYIVDPNRFENGEASRQTDFSNAISRGEEISL